MTAEHRPPHRRRNSQPPPPPSLHRNLGTIALLILVLFFLFAARIIYSPLLLSIEQSLGLSHAQAASFFLFTAIGYGAVMVFSGFVAARIGHRNTILLSVLLAILGLFALSLSRSLWQMRGALMLVGVGAGLYFPSGVPTLTSLVKDSEQGKALAAHEMGPNLSLVIAPIATVFALRLMSWQTVIFVLACLGMVVGILFLLLAKGGRFRGKAPYLKHARLILKQPSFWIMTVLFSLGAGAGMGLFAMTPTYLITERGMDGEMVNTLIGLSRISSLVMVFLSGYLVDRIGFRRVMVATMLAAGLCTAGMALRARPFFITAVFLQPVLVSCFFPAGFTAIARIASRDMYNLTISFMFPIGYTFAAGLVPLFLGMLGDRLSFAVGFLVYGALLAASALLPRFLKFPGDTTLTSPAKTALGAKKQPQQ